MHKFKRVVPGIMGVALLALAALFIGGCATSGAWVNKNTGEKRDTLPTFQDCYFQVKGDRLDRDCLDKCNRMGGPGRGADNSLCVRKCYKKGGGDSQTRKYDEDCAQKRAAQQGWEYKTGEGKK